MRKILLFCLSLTLFIGVNAQNAQTSSSSMTAGSWSVRVPFDIDDEGKEYQFMFGMGGWSWDFFAFQQRNHAGKENMQIARVGCTLPFSEAYTTLPATVKNTLNTELNNTSQTGVKKVFFLPGIGNVGTEQGEAASKPTWSTEQRENYVNNIVLAAEYIISRGYEIFGVAPFNEPDFETTWTGNASNYNAVSAIMQTKPQLAGKIVGPSTLNSSEAPKWYTTVKNNIDYANTHQLAGSKWSEYVGFWDQAYNDGKKPVADEMHNVMEAMACINHGGVAGTWWGWDGITRGEYIRMINGGVQLNYKERPNEWMVASVNKYKEEGGRVEAFIGTSERQAVKSSFTFVSKDRLAYYDGKGPYYDYTQNVPGGAKGSYQNGQTNAERLIIINTGEDVPVEQVNGKYKIVSKVSGKVLSMNGGAASRGNVLQYADGALKNQSWDVYPIDSLTVPDFSYVVIRNSNTSGVQLYLDAEAWKMESGANVSVWSDNDDATCPPNGWQRWHLRYVGDGYYHVINHNTGLYMAVLNGNTSNGANVCEMTNDGTDKLLWKFIPADSKVETEAPAKPTGLKATPESGSVLLEWADNTEEDICGYMVYRYNNEASIWECIGRKVKGTSFRDNTCRKGQPLKYKIKALDTAYNLSDASDEIESATTAENALIAAWSGRSVKDSSPNKMHAVISGATLKEDNEHASFSFDGTDDFIKLPYHSGDMSSMTFSAWVKGSSTSAWQRIFDFGNGEDEYVFLAARNGDGKVRFEIKKNGTTQGLDAAAITNGTWTHVAVTIAKNDVKIYLNGVESAASTTIDITPADVVPTVSYLGRSQFDADPAFKGLMSDVRIYNYPMTADEIKALSEITSNLGGYDITAERIPGIADDIANWTVTGNWATWTGEVDGDGFTVPYLRIGESGTSRIAKTLNFLPEGSYKISAACMSYYKSTWLEGSATGITLFGNETTTTVNTRSKKAAKTLSITANVSADNTLEFGIDANNTNATIIAMDDVTIQYTGTSDEFIEGINGITKRYIADGDKVVGKLMNREIEAALNDTYGNAKSVCEAYVSKISEGQATYEDYSTWATTIQGATDAINSAKASIVAYETLGTEIAKAYEHAAKYQSETTIDAFGLAEIATKHNEGQYADSEIPGIIETVKAITLDYIMSCASPSNPVDITEWFIKSASFDGTYTGWTVSKTPTSVSKNGLEYAKTNFKITQVLKNMPAGKYRLDTRAFYRYGNQTKHKTAYDEGTLVRSAKLFISDSEGENVADIMAISDDPSAQHEVGTWSSQLYDGNPVPDDMDAAGAAFNLYGKYQPRDGYNSITIEHAAAGDITIGAKKEKLTINDWTVIGDFSLFYYGDYIVLDEDCESVPSARENTNIVFSRTFDEAEWNTICLPFAMSEEQVKEAFGESVELQKLTSATTGIEYVDLFFTTSNAIEANTPYIIKGMSNGTFNLSGVNYTPAQAVTEVEGASFRGVYAVTALDNAEGQDYYITADGLAASAGTETLKAFRAYFKLPADSQATAVAIYPEGTTPTSIDGINGNGSTITLPADIYSASGQLIRRQATDLNGLPRGVYIIGKQKLVVK